MNTTAGYGENCSDYQRLAKDWEYNLESGINVFGQDYNHPYSTQFEYMRNRSSGGYGTYHDGFEPYKPDGSADSKYEKNYLKIYDQ